MQDAQKVRIKRIGHACKQHGTCERKAWAVRLKNKWQAVEEGLRCCKSVREA
jgi:hypothetical protein